MTPPPVTARTRSRPRGVAPGDRGSARGSGGRGTGMFLSVRVGLFSYARVRFGQLHVRPYVRPTLTAVFRCIYIVFHCILFYYTLLYSLILSYPYTHGLPVHSQPTRTLTAYPYTHGLPVHSRLTRTLTAYPYTHGLPVHHVNSTKY